MRNKLAGKLKGKSKSARYFALNPDSREKKNEYNKEYHSTEEMRRYRSRLNKANRASGSKVGDGKDVSHKADGSTTLEKASSNRARNGRGNTRRLK
jgi:hypothetical protein